MANIRSLANYKEQTIMPEKDKIEYKQIIVARLDINMSAGKFAAQVSHASMAFLTNQLRQNARRLDCNTVRTTCDFDYGIWQGWINGIFTKIVLGVKDKKAMDKLIRKAKEHGMEEGKDFFPIYDNCRTQLIAEEPDGTCLTCVGFRPMHNDEIDPVTKRIRLYT